MHPMNVATGFSAELLVQGAARELPYLNYVHIVRKCMCAHSKERSLTFFVKFV